MSVTSPPAENSANDSAQVESPSAGERMSEECPLAETRRRPNPLLLVVGLLPFLAVPLAHVMSGPESASGFFHYELPYYVANGRAAFERGNGVLYPNPYNPAADAPKIYAHWLPWTLGLLTVPLQLNPGDVMLCVTFFAALLFAWTTYQLVGVRTELVREQQIAYLTAMVGGGFLCLAGYLFTTGSGLSPGERWLSIDPGHGMWFLNWGRNALFPTEAIYHSLVGLCWMAEITRRRKLANVWLLLLATTHPWSGLELLLTVNLWRGLQFLSRRNSEARGQLLFSGTLLVVFLGYYKGWLPTFPSHAALQSVWELNWSLPSRTALLAYLPVAIPCVIHVTRQFRTDSLTATEKFLLCALVVATGLAFHDRLIKPVQPLHFTRGYVWMPMFLLGLPVTLQFFRSLQNGTPIKRFAAIGLVVLLLADNLIFAAVHCHRQMAQQDGFHLSTDERSLLSSLREKRFCSQVVLTSSAQLNYLIPTYAPLRPWLGHQFNTPDFPDRRQVWQNCFADSRVHADIIPADVDLLIFRSTIDAKELAENAAWRPVQIANPEWQCWQRSEG